MVRKGKLMCILLCIGLLAVCMAGCGAVDNNVEINEDVRADETVETDKAAVTEEVIVEDEKADLGEISDTEQTDIENIKEEDTPKGPGLSILGDSISTYDGWIPEGFNVFYPFSGEVTDVSQTWWMQLLDDMGMELCSNDSSSGSTCVGDSLAVGDPQYGCSTYRLSYLTGQEGRMPDIIIVYMGTNDLLQGIPMGDNDGTKLVEEGVIENFSDAYCLILDKMLNDYPAAQIYCCTLLPVGEWGVDQPFVTYTNGLGLTSEDYSKQIQLIAENKGIPVIDLYHCGIEIDNLLEMTSDGVHLTPDGMKCVESAILNGIGETVNE